MVRRIPGCYIARMLRSSLCLLLLALSSALYAHVESLGIDVLDEEMSVTRFPADGDHLILWVAPGYGTTERAARVAKDLAADGIEVWHVDLSESLFLPKSSSTMRALDGRFVAGLIEEAHERTGKTLTLVSRSYGALPVLRGARLWQKSRQNSPAEAIYLTGAILFSPELYSEIPPLGLPPVFDPIIDATTIPLMIFQGGNRNNRWQLDELLTRLQEGGSPVYHRIYPGVTGMFYEEDDAAATLERLPLVGSDIRMAVKLLEQIETPLTVLALEAPPVSSNVGLDIELKPFQGNPVPLPLDLLNADGERVRVDDYRGQVTVVNFWASWCGPCVEEIPALNRLRERMADKAFELISVDYAEDIETIEAFLQQVQVDFPVLLDSDGRVSAEWGALVFPSTFIIGPDGRIVYGVNGALHWDSDEVVEKLEALLPAAP